MTRIGIIGESKGNGHPYSWSAIINGFNKNLLHTVPFELIKQYLSKINGDLKKNKNVKITKIYCENLKYAQSVAKFANIKKVESNLRDFGQDIDAIIIAKDDYQNHYSLLKKLVNFKIPILIDKPIATDQITLKRILKLKKTSNHFYTGSGLTFSKEIEKMPKDFKNIQEIRALSNGPWDRYSVHLINILENYFKINGYDFHKYKEIKTIKKDKLTIEYSSLNLSLNLNLNNFLGVRFKFIFKNGTTKFIYFKNTYFAFKNFLDCFIKQVQTGKNFFKDEDILKTVKLIELGKSFE